MKLEISASQLSFGTQGDDVARVHQALGRNITVAERAKRALGAETVAVLKSLQAGLGLSATGIVDAATVRAINVKLVNLAADQNE